MICRMKQAGYSFMDLGMVTTFTKQSFKAKYVTREKFIDLIKNRPDYGNINLIDKWNPMVEKIY